MIGRHRYGDFVVGLDVGSDKVSCIVARIAFNSGKLEIVGVGDSPSKGLRRGMIISMESVISSIRAAVRKACKMAKFEIKQVIISISGPFVYGMNCQASIEIKNNEIKKEDAICAIDAAKSTALEEGRRILHVLPQEFIVDNHFGVRDPVGMAAKRLTANVHVISTAENTVLNLVHCVQSCSLGVKDIVFGSLASACSILSKNEHELGIAVVDIGAGTTDISIFTNGYTRHTCVIPVGGRHLTNDISIGLSTTIEDAEKIKKRYGFAGIEIIEREDVIRVPGIMGKPERILNRKELGDIIKPRVEELFELIAKEINFGTPYGSVVSGIVLCGGFMLLPGAVNIAELIIGLPVKISFPFNLGGLFDMVSNPIYSTCVGVILRETRANMPTKNQETNCLTLKDKLEAMIRDII